MNFFEQLVSEWYEYQGYFAFRNKRIGRAELDVIACLPDKQLLVHIETGQDACSEGELNAKISRKMRFSAAEYAKAMNYPVGALQKKAIYGWKKTYCEPRQLGDVTVTTLYDFVREINDALRRTTTDRNGIHQKYPLLSAMAWSLAADAVP